MFDIIAIVIGYLIGAIPFGLIITRLMGSGDIRQVGSGNVGATNAVRAAGPLAGILVLVFDIGKGVAAVMIAAYMPESVIGFGYLKLAVGFAAIIGHIFPVYLGFKGGKGVNTALGVMLTLMTYQALISIVVFILTVSLSRYISLGSILGSLALFIAVLIGWWFEFWPVPDIYVIVALVLVVLITVVHRSNIKRLFNGNENRFSLKAKVGES